MPHAMISIIMPILNGARFMDQAIASVVAQTSREWELLIVDDGSSDDSLARAGRWKELVDAHFGEAKIRLFQTGGTRSGGQIPRNLGASNARSDILAYLDMDDLYFPMRIESLLPLFQGFDLVFAPYQLHEEGRLGLHSLKTHWERAARADPGRHLPFDEWLRGEVQRTNVSVQLGVAHRHEIFKEVGGFQPGIIAASEGVLWRRMIDHGARVGFCPVTAGRYNIRPDSQARTRLPFASGGFELRQDHPLGANGQYLDAEWFAALADKNGQAFRSTS